MANEEIESATEREEMPEHLTERVGFTLAEAERAMRDNDLWVLLPEQRLRIPYEEAVKEWREASLALDALVLVADRLGFGTTVAIVDAQER